MKHLFAVAALFSVVASAMPPAGGPVCPPVPYCSYPTHRECRVNTTSPMSPTFGCNVCWCAMPPQPVNEYGVLTVKYYPTHVIYAPPGRGSAMSYSTGTAIGTTVTVSDDHQTSIKVTVGASAKVPLVGGGSLDVGVGNIWGTTRTDALDVAVTRTSGYKKAGSIDDVDHDEDEVWFLVNPKLLFTATPDSYYGPSTVTWTFQADQQLQPYFLYVGELRGTWPIPKDVQDNLNRWGFRPQDLRNLLSTHPFPNGREPGEPVNPARFEYLATFAYRPPARAGTAPSTQTFELARKVINSTAKEEKNTFTVDVTVSAGFNFLKIFEAHVKVDQGLKITTSTSVKNAVTDETKSNLSLTQPAFGYTGPTVLRVYQDKMFKTFVFGLDWY